MNTLLIEKQTGGYFKFTLNGDTANAITSINNDLLAVGNQLHFKTGNGANIIKEQFIYPADVTIISGGTFTFTTVAQVWDKLIAIDYFAWLGGGGTGGVDRFDDLLDTFSYIGNAGKAVVVDNSELKLVPITLYNKRLFTELEDTPNSLVPDKMVVVNPAGTALIFQDQPEPPAEYLNSVGYFDYNDLATQTTPLNAVANVALKLTNDTEGANTSTDQNPYGVSYVWDYVTNQFNFSELEVGDTIDVRVHVQVTTTTSNQKVSLSAKFGIGSVAEFTNSIFETTFKTSGLHEISFVAPFYMGSTYITDYPAELYLTTDASATVNVDGWYVRILRKNINIITVDYQVEDATTTTKGIVRLAGDLSGTANNPTVPELANKVPTSRTVSTTSPLLGGGALSSNLTLSIQQANSIQSGFVTFADWNRFDEAHNDRIVSAAVTGTTTKTLTLNQHDGGTITANWTDNNTDAVTSVFGRTGAVVAANGDYTTTQVTEGNNLYYTEARVDANTNVSANTAARHSAVTIGAANGLSLSGQALSLALASTSATGALSSTDWNTFNGKQAALSGTGFVKISGTTISYDNSTYALDSAVVHLAGTETITGNKTFTTEVRTIFQNGDAAQITFKNTGDLTKTLNIGHGSNGNIFSSTGLDFRVGGLTSSALLIASNENATFKENLTAKSFIKSGGTSSQFLKADGSVDSTTYQTALTNPVTGTGTTNYIPKFTGASAIGNSSIFDNGQVNIGSTSFAGDELLMVSMNGTTNTQAINVKDRNASGNGSTFMVFRKSDDTFLGNIRRSGTSDALYIGGNSFLALGHSGNTEAMRITSGGNVGIGTTSPSFAFGSGLHVKSNSGWGEIRIEGQSFAGGTGSAVSFTSEGTTLADIYADTDKNLSFRTNGASERMRILANGNVGIGTTSPSQKLEVSGGAAQFNGGNIDGTLGDAILFGNTTYPTVQKNRIRSSISATGANNLLVLETSTATAGTYNANQLVLKGDGNVGIGTTSPSTICHLYKASFPILTIQSSSYQSSLGIDTTSGNLVLNNESNAPLSFNTNATERMRITSGGNVGIGTTLCEAPLDLRSTYKEVTSGEFTQYIGSTTTQDAGRGGSLGFGGFTNGTSGTITFSGFKGFKENGDGGNTAGALAFYTRPNSGAITERMRITSGGNVLIGTTTDAGYKLDVNGTGRFSGLLQVNGPSATTRSDSDGISVFNGNVDYRIGFDSVNATRGYIRYSVDSALSTHGHIFSAGDWNSTLTDLMLIRGDGNVGIGTTSPSEKLEVQNGASGAKIKVSNSGGGYAMLECSSNATSTAQLSFTNQLSLIGGNVGIATTSPSYTLHVNGSVAGTSAYNNLSDKRYKKDILPIENALDKILALNGVTFNWDKEATDMNLDDNNHIGLLAQDVEEILPQAVTTGTDENKTKSVAYTDLVPVLIEAIKELKAEIEILKNK